jgi:fucose 4-O-acetylase-like acetyltransferase
MRDEQLDAQKGALILLVVFCHILEVFQGWANPVLVLLLRPVYAFHMPAFIMIAGRMAKAAAPIRRILPTLLSYLAFQVLYSLPSLASLRIRHIVAYPFWIMWFLLSMCLWYIAAPIIARSRYAVSISVIVALLAGFLPFDGYILSLSRTAVFLPFFVAGHVHDYGWQHRIRHCPLPIAGVTATLLIASINFFAVDGDWLRGALTYRQMNVDPITGLLSRAMLLLVAFLLIICFSRGIGPVRWLARYGRHTLPVYLLHAAILLPLDRLFGSDIIRMSPVILLLIAALGTLVITHCLALDTIDRPMRGLFHSAAATILKTVNGSRPASRRHAR